MKDIDFDELDRAVNSLVNPDASAPAVAADPVDIPAPAPQPTVAVAAAPLAARRSSGRFMDVVHPSSDMRVAVPERPTSREGATIAPSDPVESAAPAVAVAAPVPAPSTDMPDPLDFHGFTPGAQDTIPTDIPAPVSAVADELAASLAESAESPLESPFISDAKVEKRPLGAFSDDAAVAVAAEAVSTPTEPEPVPEPPVSEPAEPTTEPTTDEDEAKDTHPMGNDTPLPAELQGDVLSIEASEETATVAAGAPSDAPIGPTSITQQYTEQASTGDQPAGSIFDTEAYKKPLAHPKKKQSGWLMVLWILLLLIIGAGAGAAVYFYVLPLL